MAPPSAREIADRVEAANQTVTGLLQKIDGNIARATDFAAQLLPQVPPSDPFPCLTIVTETRGG